MVDWHIAWWIKTWMEKKMGSNTIPPWVGPAGASRRHRGFTTTLLSNRLSAWQLKFVPRLLQYHWYVYLFLSISTSISPSLFPVLFVYQTVPLHLSLSVSVHISPHFPEFEFYFHFFCARVTVAKGGWRKSNQQIATVDGAAWRKHPIICYAHKWQDPSMSGQYWIWN